jgi:anti-sigma-K factor RskA
VSAAPERVERAQAARGAPEVSALNEAARRELPRADTTCDNARDNREMSKVFWGSCVVISACAVFSGCAASPPRAETSASISEAPPQPAEIDVAPECVNDQDQHVACLADSDCCAGFVCGKDPELSQDVSYCIYGGGA